MDNRLPVRLPYNYAKTHGVLIRPQRSLNDDHARTDSAYMIECLYLEFPPTAIANEIVRYTGQSLAFRQVKSDVFRDEMTATYRDQSEFSSTLESNLGTSADLQSFSESIVVTHDLLSEQDNAPIIKLLNAILTEAVTAQASDIHVETFENELSVRFRIDGVLRKVFSPPRLVARSIASRVKVMARLDIAEKRLPQDGRMAVQVAGKQIDVRVSTLPTNHGERLVLRILEKHTEHISLDGLGASKTQRSQLYSLLSQPYGILLVTGPTGSGKTTTLYAALNHLNSEDRNILTIEDPVEYDLTGIGQTQVESKSDMTFARGLRAILRQDPDVVMIGEIRDLETAQIAIQASMTGHLVLSSLHTNTALGAIARMIDIGIDPFLLSNALNGVIAQRLVRLLCRDCKSPDAEALATLAKLELDTSQVISPHRATGCDTCFGTGYRGRTALYEIILIDSTLRQQIHSRAPEVELASTARRNFRSLHQDGLHKVAAGITSLDEVLRVTSLDI